MFEYLEEKHKVTIKLGQIISHDIVKSKSVFPHSNINLRGVKELNSLNRLELAKMALSKMPENYLTGTYDKKTLLNDMAKYIDKRIPQSYEKWSKGGNADNPTKIKVNAAEHGLVYHYEENQPKLKTTAAPKKRNPITKKVNASPKEEKKDPLEGNKKLTVDEQVKEANFVQLNTYLKENDLHLERDEYKATLFAMNGMAIYYQTKSGAIKKASQLFNVTQKSIKQHIDDMNIISERASKNGGAYRKEIGRQSSIANSEFKRRLERED